MNKSVHGEGGAHQVAASARRPRRPGGKEAPRSEIDALRAENARLRRALDEAQMKLRLLSVSRVPDENEYRPVASKRETGNGGVAYAQMRRLLLKDDTFLRTNFLAFFNIVDLGRCVLLSRCCIVTDSGVVGLLKSQVSTTQRREMRWIVEFFEG